MHETRLLLGCAALLAAGVLLAPVLPGQGADGGPAWPHWRGPDRNGISTESDWSVGEQLKTLWQAEVGLGYSCVSIQDGRLYTQGHDKEAREDTVYCLDATTGEPLWSHTFAAKTMAKAHKGGALCTPSIDGTRVFVNSREGEFFCFEAASGKVLWDQNWPDEVDTRIPTWGFAAAPLVLADRIVLNVGRVVSFDRDGEVQWTSDDYGHAYSTPAPFEHDGKACLAVFNGNGLAVLATATGEELAFSEWKTRYDVNAATPVVVDDKIFISSGYNRGCSMLQFDGSSLQELWASKVMRNHMSGCVEVGGFLYGFDEGTLKCLDLDGNEQWGQRGLGKGALVVAGDRIVALSHRGELVVAAVDPEEYRELARHAILEGGVQWTTPVVCGGLIYCRNNQGQLVCVDARP